MNQAGSSSKTQSGWEQFPCDSCGSTLFYAPGTDSLSCSHCGHDNPINELEQDIPELDYEATIRRMSVHHEEDSEVVIHCNECGSEYRLENNMHADTCEFCGSTVVAETAQHRQLEPQGVIPFGIDQQKADAFFTRWIGKLWLAPRDLKRYARKERQLSGIYIPYWTFDSDTRAAYQGKRGTYYQVPQRVVRVVNGRRQTVTQMVTRVRWTPVSGRVQRQFDDVLVEASFSLPKKMLRKLDSWNLKALKKYNKSYLSGFKSEMYQGGPQEGFQQAQHIMDEVLRDDISRQIGGDIQRITRMNSAHDNVDFKHILLPIWVAAYKYRGKSYRFVVNGQSGEVQGERPYSRWKIIMLAAMAMGMLAAGFFAYEEGYLPTEYYQMIEQRPYSVDGFPSGRVPRMPGTSSY